MNRARIAPGTVLVGKYRVDQVLGEGGMGVVLAATHLQLRQPVAIKLLHPEALEQGHAVERFVREARAAAGIQSEHVVRVFDVGTLEDGAPFLVMEHLTGEDLASVLQRRGPLPAAEAIDYLLQACVAIAEAHAMGIVHRDLKPANLFLAKRKDGASLIKVLDFGISKEMNPTDGGLTGTTQAMGSPFYMSPEQIRSSRNVDQRTDIWALGAILVELLSARLPFEGDTVGGVFAAIAADPAPPLRQLRADASPELEAVVARCLTKDPRQRPPNIASLARDLFPFAPGSRASLEKILAISASANPDAVGDTLLGPGTPAAAVAGVPAGVASSIATAQGSAGPGVSNAGPAPLTGGAWGATQTAFAPAPTKPGRKGLFAAASVGLVLVCWIAFHFARPAATTITSGTAAASPPLAVPSASAAPSRPASDIPSVTAPATGTAAAAASAQLAPVQPTAQLPVIKPERATHKLVPITTPHPATHAPQEALDDRQ